MKTDTATTNQWVLIIIIIMIMIMIMIMIIIIIIIIVNRLKICVTVVCRKVKPILQF